MRELLAVMQSAGRHAWLVLLFSATVAGCGGGGGGSVAGSITLSGVAQFASVPNDPATGRLLYASAIDKPIRGATVQALNSTGAVLASGTTDAAGAYSLVIPSQQPVTLRVRAEMRRTGATGGQWNFSVRDNTSSNALYAVDSASFTPASANETRHVYAASGWGGAGYTGARAAGPFAILDVVHDAMQKVLSVSPDQSFPALRLFWSVNNRPASGSLTAGNIGTSFYTFDGAHSLYLLGAANSDTDEYDTHVVAHEWGHYFQNAFSRDDSVGGLHGSGDRLDMRVAFSEGWGNAWSGMALGGPIYADSVGIHQAQGGIIDVSQSPTSNPGWYSEESVQKLLWDSHADPAIGFGPIFSVMTGSLTTSGALTSIHNFAHQLKASVPAAAAGIDTRLQAQSVTVQDAFGTNETNDGGVALALPVYKTHTAALGASQSYCVARTAQDTGNGNRLGNHAYVRFTLGSSGNRTITLSAAAGGTGTDPDFEILRADGGTVSAFSANADVETLTTSLPAGTHVIALTDYNLSGTRCFNLQVQ